MYRSRWRLSAACGRAASCGASATFRRLSGAVKLCGLDGEPGPQPVLAVQGGDGVQRHQGNEPLLGIGDGWRGGRFARRMRHHVMLRSRCAA
jgi:hypothetical protein